MSDLVKRLVNLHLYELANDVGDLEAELAEARKDTARLDWLMVEAWDWYEGCEPVPTLMVGDLFGDPEAIRSAIDAGMGE